MIVSHLLDRYRAASSLAYAEEALVSVKAVGGLSSSCGVRQPRCVRGDGFFALGVSSDQVGARKLIAASPQEVIKEARRLLKSTENNLAHSLEISGDYLVEGDWLHLIITPTDKDLSALEFVDAIEFVEDQLRRKYSDEILIVPAKPCSGDETNLLR